MIFPVVLRPEARAEFDEAFDWYEQRRAGSHFIMLVADMRHYLDEDGCLPDLPEPALNIAFHLGAIVGWVSRFPSNQLQATNVPCRRRPRRRRCLGEIEASFDPRTGVIEWTCPVCADSGIISGWRGTLWDKTSLT